MKIFETKKQNQQLVLTYSAFALNGMLALSIGSLLPFIRDARGLDYALCGLLVSLHSVGNLVSSFTAGILPLFIGRKKSILFFETFFALCYALILFTGSPFWIAAAFFISGLARGAASNYGNTKINNLAPGKAVFSNGLHAMFSVGAFLFPILLMAITRNNSDNWVYACIFMLVIGIITWILYLLNPEDEDKPLSAKRSEKKTSDDVERFGFFKEPLFYLTIGTLFFYLCAEQGVIGWMITYFKDTGLLTPGLSQITASVQWMMVLLGRLTAAYLSTKMKKSRMLPVMGAGLVLFFLLLIFSRTPALIMAGIVGFGFSMAGIYPTTVSVAGNMIKKYDLCWNFILTLASLGSIIMPSIIGRIAETQGITTGMSSVAIVVLIDMCMILALVFYAKKHVENA